MGHSPMPWAPRTVCATSESSFGSGKDAHAALRRRIRMDTSRMGRTEDAAWGGRRALAAKSGEKCGLQTSESRFEDEDDDPFDYAQGRLDEDEEEHSPRLRDMLGGHIDSPRTCRYNRRRRRRAGVATFDELAERLTRGATAADRIAAAEGLARLDDPRVAPALAKALGDVSPDARRRVEELLAEFSHREGDDHLRTLLDEAQRVSSALAAEVSRLRGEPVDDGEPVKLEPIEPPDGYGGGCVVVRLDATLIDVKRPCQIVANGLGEAMFTITRELHLTKGIFARAVPAEAARQMVRELGKAGVPAAAAPADWLPLSPELVRLRRPQLGPKRLEGVLLPDARRCTASWDSVELVVAGRIEVELKLDKGDEDWSPFTRPLRPRADGAKSHGIGYEYVLDIFAGQPLQRLRLMTHELDFEIMQRRPSDFSSVARLARGLLRHVDRRRVTAGVRRLAELERDAWENLTFLSPLTFDDYVAWQRLLLVLGVPLPRDRI